ncbi:hypothetical protein [Streptomyces sp. SBT349]|uniref:hypothetical protein n=1 Tax=Streptomyces sp. SBT349 TaxID=1580539 RepID=UPI00066DCF54|nr:hypothetical protein [Streptomyces sp. SBT349]
MGVALKADVTVGNQALPATCFLFGETFPKERKRGIREGWGFDIELPAVMDILAAVQAGNLTADQALTGLLEAVDHLYDPSGCFDYEDSADKRDWCERDGGCEACARHQNMFDQMVRDASESWRRFQLPDQYPFTVGKRGLHTTTCSVVTREMPKQFAPPSGEAYERALRDYAHAANSFMDSGFYENFDGDFDRKSVYPSFRPVTPEETRVWVADHTGPKGGRNYKRCQRCAPTP